MTRAKQKKKNNSNTEHEGVWEGILDTVVEIGVLNIFISTSSAGFARDKQGH